MAIARVVATTTAVAVVLTATIATTTTIVTWKGKKQNQQNVWIGCKVGIVVWRKNGKQQHD